MEVEPSTWYSSRVILPSIDPAHWGLTSQLCLCSNHHSTWAHLLLRGIFRSSVSQYPPDVWTWYLYFVNIFHDAVASMGKGRMVRAKRVLCKRVLVTMAKKSERIYNFHRQLKFMHTNILLFFWKPDTNHTKNTNITSGTRLTKT